MIYLDNAATSFIKPKEVARAVVRAMESCGNPGRGVHGGSMAAMRSVYEVREILTDFFHAEDPSRIAFTSNATESLNIAVKGLFQPGDHVISTVLEHNSVLRPLYEIENKGVRVTLAGCDRQGRLKLEDIEAAIDSDTKGIICTHASNLTGNLVDVSALGKLAREKGLLFVVDASQTAGIMDIDVQKMGIDVLCFTGHKGLMGPQGTGGIYVREGINVRPLKSGGSGIKTFQKSHPDQMPEALEAGTLNGHGIAGLGAAVSFIDRVGIEKIREKEEELMYIFYEGIRDIPGITVYGDFSSPLRCPIVSFNLGDLDSGMLADELYNQYGICVRAGGHCAPMMHQALGTEKQGAVRFSFSYFNSREEVETAVAAVREMAKNWL